MKDKKKVSNEEMLEEIKRGLYVMVRKRSTKIAESNKLESMKTLSNIIMKEENVDAKDNPETIARVIDEYRKSGELIRNHIKEQAIGKQIPRDNKKTSVDGNDTDPNAGKDKDVPEQDKTDIHK